MNVLINISDAAAIGLHAVVLLANQDKPVSAAYIADQLEVSKHHLSKVLHDLVVAGLIISVKGPKGGFKLSHQQLETTFMQVLEALEGKVKPADCLFNRKRCSKQCILGDLLKNLNSGFTHYFNNTKIKNFKEK